MLSPKSSNSSSFAFAMWTGQVNPCRNQPPEDKTRQLTLKGLTGLPSCCSKFGNGCAHNRPLQYSRSQCRYVCLVFSFHFERLREIIGMTLRSLWTRNDSTTFRRSLRSVGTRVGCLLLIDYLATFGVMELL